jgi:hypothetical protein
MKFLVDAGVPRERLQAKGFGESRPINSNRTDAGRARTGMWSSFRTNGKLTTRRRIVNQIETRKTPLFEPTDRVASVR